MAPFPQELEPPEIPGRFTMCAYLLLACIKFTSCIEPSFQQMFRLLQLNLFERRDLLQLLKADSPEPPDIPIQTQLQFS